MKYKRRIADKLLVNMLIAVLVEGAKWCGKSTTTEQQARSILYMNQPKDRAMNLQLAQIKTYMWYL